jgi:formamidopyrimidine-DNA glycosylase
MPELPDVETFKRHLVATSLHQRIGRVEVLSADLLKGVSERELAHKLRGHRFESSRREGKHLFVRVDHEIRLQLHFGMTGSLRYFKGEKKAPPHTRIPFVFEKDFRLAFDDQRKFGEVGLIKNVDKFFEKARTRTGCARYRSLGIQGDARETSRRVEIDFSEPAADCGHRQYLRRRILFHSRIHPAVQIATLSDKALQRLFGAMLHVLEKAIEYHANAGCMPRSWLLPHRGKAGKCPRCRRELQPSTIGSRTAWFCPHCQK